MKLIRQMTPTRHAGGGHSRPQWLKEWLADQPQFVLLGCGHKDDIKIAGTIILKVYGGDDVEVLCDRCDKFQRVVRKVSLSEYANIAAKPVPNEPMF